MGSSICLPNMWLRLAVLCAQCHPDFQFPCAQVLSLPLGRQRLLSCPHAPQGCSPRACLLRCSLHRVFISNARMLFRHKPLTAVSNFDQTCEQYGTDAQFAPEYE